MNSKFKELDIYGEQIGLTYKGESSFKTTPGAITSLLVLMIMFAFSIYRFEIFVNKKDPDVSRQSFLRNLDAPTEYLTPSDYGFEFAIGIGKPIQPENGSLVANIISFDYLEDKSSNSKMPRKRKKNKTQLDLVPCGFDYFKGFNPEKIDMYNIPR